MAFSLLTRVASKALDKVGSAASSAFNYLTKNAPDVIGQKVTQAVDAMNYGKFGTRDSNIAQAPVRKPIENIFKSTFLGKGLTGQIDFTDPRAQEDLAFNTISGVGGMTKPIVKKATDTIFREASEKVPTLLKKTSELFEKGKNTPKNFSPLPEMFKNTDEVANRDVAMDYLKKSRQPADAMQTVGEVLEPGKTANLFQKGKDIARKWINTREGYTQWRAADIKKNPQLTQFDKEGITAIIDLQSGANPARYQPIKEFTDGLFQLEKKAGILEPGQYRKNYLPQMWDNTPEEIEQVFKNKTVGGTPGFSKTRMFEDYQAGIEAGLTPRYTSMSDLLESRFKTAQKALADNELVENLVKTGNAKTLDKAPKGWQTVDLKYKGKPLAVDVDTAKIINNYTTEGTPWLEKTAQFVSEAKQTILSAGIPRSGWNFHTGVNVPVRAMTARKNPFGAMVDSVIWNTNPKSAVDYIEKTVPKDITDGLLKEGLSISRSNEASGYGFKPKVGKGVISKGRDVFDKLFSEVAFDKVLPAHKLKVGWEAYQRALKGGSTQDEAFRIGAQTSNEVFGGVNSLELGRNKDFQNMLRTLLLAPDWLESNVRLGGRMGGLLNPKNWSKAEYAPFKKFAVNATAMYSTFAMTNKALSGHWPWENGVGQEFNLATGTYDDRGRERMIPAFGTAFDFVRLPYQMVTGAIDDGAKGLFRPIRNRLSPPVAAATSLFVTGEDYRGRPIDDIGDVAGQAASAVGVPSQTTNTLAFLRGDSTGEELASNLLEAPLRYRGGANTAEKRSTAELLKEGGASNEDVNAAFKTSGGGQNDGLFSKLFGKDDYSTLGTNSEGKIVMPKTKKEREAFNKSVDTALENGSVDLPDNAILARFFDGKTYDKSARKGQQDILNEMLKVADDEFLTPEQKAKIANAAKIDQADLQYYRTASMDQDSRLEGLLEYANSVDPKNRDEFIENLLLGKKEVGGKSLFSTTMFNRLYDEGLISKDEKALITATKYDPIYNKFYMDRDYKGGGGGLTPAQIRSRISSVNALFKKTIKGTSSVDKQLKELSKPIEAPKIKFSRPRSSSPRSSDQWFTPY